MEIIGNDKKLRALYDEARVADQTAMPGFTSVWHRAQARSLKPRRAFNLSFALVTALLVLTLGSLAVWSMYSFRGAQPHEAVKKDNGSSAPAPSMTPEQPKNESVNTAGNNSPNPVEAPVRRPRQRVKRSTATPETQTLAQNKTVKETTIDTWQSPTAALLTSPTDGLFKSLPQLDENASEMKSSLPGRPNDKENDHE